MVEAALGLGSNLGDRTGHLTGAVQALDATEGIEIKAVSSLWETPPWGNEDQPHFLNACALVETSLTPMDLLEVCLAIERDHGRERRERWGPRTLDIDILLFGSLQLMSETLTIPHPRMSSRAFVLSPLAEIVKFCAISGLDFESQLAALDSGGLRCVGPFPHWRKPEPAKPATGLP